MKLILSSLFSLLISFGVSQAYDAGDLQKLKATGSCRYGCDLSQADLQNQNLYNAMLYHSNFTMANFTGANLTLAAIWSADLTGANLTGAVLNGAFLTDANLTGANLTGADLIGADLTDADLTDADLTGANLAGANLERAKGLDLSKVDLNGVNLSVFSGVNLNDLDITGADLSGMDLSGMDLSGKNLSWVTAGHRECKGGGGGRGHYGHPCWVEGVVILDKANLSNANLRWAVLNGSFKGTNFSGANLTGAEIDGDFSGANFTGADLRGTVLNKPDLADPARYSHSRRYPLGGRNKNKYSLDPNPFYYTRHDGRNLFFASWKFTGAITEGIKIDSATYLPKNFPFGVASSDQSPTPIPPTIPPATPLPDNRLLGTGTAFVVNKNYLITAAHVLSQCNSVSIRHAHEEFDVEIAAWDEANDLGLLKSETPFEHITKFRSGNRISIGERIATHGYPLFGELSDSAKITQGNINSLAGVGNDSRVIQFDAPTQPGNSGGPVLDGSGNVVGVVSAGLSKKYADQTGHIAQNVNFAVKSYLVEGFLSSNNVSFEKADSTQKLELPDIAEKAERFTVLVGCWE